MIKKFTLGLALAVSAALMPAATATAADYPVEKVKGAGTSACPADSVCLYQDSNFNLDSGDDGAWIWVVKGTTARIPDGGNDETSSVYSTLNRGADVWMDANYKGDSFYVPRFNENYASLKNVPQGHMTANFNDSISSVTFDNF
ncbi:peptidase inhibitor family I36 protein [Streptomyces sp. NPDC056105]|uniref:peptidase inhibitor family I36 protein n=1 Tax=Streptomyces sp. NPDC056105 TaxID=3345714 RepID=UPI0035E01BAF